MARVKRGVTARARHKKMVAQASGYRGRANSAFRIAIEKVEKALRYAYRDRRNKKRDFRGLWIQPRCPGASGLHGRGRRGEGRAGRGPGGDACRSRLTS
jgi:large subunit ribosomal protein L20